MFEKQKIKDEFEEETLDLESDKEFLKPKKKQQKNKVEIDEYKEDLFNKESAIEESREKLQKFVKFKNYLRVSVLIGISYGLLFGWMWGIKGLFIGPLIGVVMGFILAVLFTFSKKGSNDREMYN